MNLFKLISSQLNPAASKTTFPVVFQDGEKEYRYCNGSETGLQILFRLLYVDSLRGTYMRFTALSGKDCC